jgi:uncharacterized protein YlxP (DUF503 family)
VLYVCLGQVQIVLHDNNSLKHKKQVIARLRERVGKSMNCAISDASDMDELRVVTPVISVLGRSPEVVRNKMQTIFEKIDSLCVGEMAFEQLDVMSVQFDDEEFDVEDYRNF